MYHLRAAGVMDINQKEYDNFISVLDKIWNNCESYQQSTY